MRTLLKVTMDVTASNKAVMDGSLPKHIKSTLDKLKPEASYFLTVDGCRTCLIIFDLKDPSEIPGIAEPFFQTMNAKIEFSPVMNIEDLQKGLDKLNQTKE